MIFGDCIGVEYCDVARKGTWVSIFSVAAGIVAFGYDGGNLYQLDVRPRIDFNYFIY